MYVVLCVIVCNGVPDANNKFVVIIERTFVFRKCHRIRKLNQFEYTANARKEHRRHFPGTSVVPVTRRLGR